MADQQTINYPVVLFDGVCNLCNHSVQWLIARDHHRKLRFGSLQGEYGQAFLQTHQLPGETFNSFILLENDKVYFKSTAALRVLRILGGRWKLLYAFIIVPAFIRNAVYDFVAKNRYKWFGKSESCWLPTPELKSLFYT